ncbi:MAG: LapA family protein [Desulfobacca sp.]|nr:LapA family protein [Desulfobacca sp.]
MKVKTIVIAVLILLALVILFQNTQVVTLHLLLWKISMSQIIFTVATLIIGFVFGFIVTRLLTKPHTHTTTEKMTSVNDSP